MTVRVKILAISAILLLLFAVVLVGSVVMQKQSSDKVAAIIDFQLPLTAAIADLDVATFEYELSLERALRRPEVTEAYAGRQGLGGRAAVRAIGRRAIGRRWKLK